MKKMFYTKKQPTANRTRLPCRKKYSVNDYDFVNRDRGITPGIARVIAVCEDEARILFDNGQEDSFYFVHLHQNAECFRKKAQFLKERAERVGR